ncbi:type III-A CRISPR-associated RAMP protein Csm5 [Desulfobacterales bacterium HSG2]|nr:type III-A CRISPR-associated RAMP protein Csm5 [Desulfobacterales bacterium HSG2]
MKIILEVKTLPLRTVPQLVKELGISKSQFYKDRDILAEMGFVFGYDRKLKRLVIHQDSTLPVGNLTLSERLALIMALRHLSASGDHTLGLTRQKSWQQNCSRRLWIPFSIKGAIRTVFLWHLIQSTDIRPALEGIIRSRVSDQRADDALDKKLFGKTPNYDFMRGLQVGDVEFPLSDMRVVESKVFNLTDKSGGWKKMGRNGFTGQDPKKATSLYCESLNPGSVSTGKMKTGDFLFDDPLAKGLKFSDNKKELLAHLPEKCNAFARHFIANEITFFEFCKMGQMVNFYSRLQEEIPEDNAGFLLHLGWGSGWRGMTGNYMDADMLKKLRVRFNLGSRNFSEFPKPARSRFKTEDLRIPWDGYGLKKFPRKKRPCPKPNPLPRNHGKQNSWRILKNSGCGPALRTL